MAEILKAGSDIIDAVNVGWTDPDPQTPSDQDPIEEPLGRLERLIEATKKMSNPTFAAVDKVVKG